MINEMQNKRQSLSIVRTIFKCKLLTYGSVSGIVSISLEILHNFYDEIPDDDNINVTCPK